MQPSELLPDQDVLLLVAAGFMLSSSFLIGAIAAHPLAGFSGSVVGLVLYYFSIGKAVLHPPETHSNLISAFLLLSFVFFLPLKFSTMSFFLFDWKAPCNSEPVHCPCQGVSETRCFFVPRMAVIAVRNANVGGE